MELSLRLDGDGRTACDPALRPPPPAPAAASSSYETDGPGHRSAKRPRTGPPPGGDDAPRSPDYASRTTLTGLASLDPSTEESLGNLLFDCEVADFGLLPRSFWVPAAGGGAGGTTGGGGPRCFLERMALEVFRHHVPPPAASNGGFRYDPATSGAEWWVQLRPSPPGTGRYSMLAGEGDGRDDDMTKSGISFHWDKDEDLRLATAMHVHPHISTVTYLTGLGAPTVVLSKRVDPMTGEHLEETGAPSLVEGLVSWPRQGKHLR